MNIFKNILFVRFRLFILALFILPIVSCASNPMISAQVNSLVVAEKFDHARRLMEENKEGYGKNNQLLYWLDYGLLLHLAGEYEQSIDAFEKSKALYDELYTESLTKKGATWLINDYIAPYRGEDFERVLINIFQAVNFIQLGDFQEALVEARDVDDRLNSINLQYDAGEKNIYKEDAFARFLMGMIYEVSGNFDDINDAYISYRKALKIYEENFKLYYRVPPPEILIENLLSVAKEVDVDEFKLLKKRYSLSAYIPFEEKKKKAEVYLIYYYGLSPIKNEGLVAFPLPGGYIYKLAFPRYIKREYNWMPKAFAVQLSKKERYEIKIEKAHDIRAIAIQNLENRRLRVLAKAATRSTGKYFLERTQADMIRSNYNDEAADAFEYISNIFNIASEQADLRSWQTLPGEIKVSRMLVEPGEYEYFVDKDPIGSVSLKAGEKKFFVYRMNE